MGRNKKLDRLTLDSIEAEKAGMSYGKWKAMHPHREMEDEDIPNDQPQEGCCVICGNPLQWPQRRFCSRKCQNGFNYRKNRPTVPRKKEYGHG